MSRIGKMPIPVPAGVDVTIDGQTVTVKGPKGELTRTFLPSMTITRDGDAVGLVNVPGPDADGSATAFASGFQIFDNGDAEKLQVARDFLSFVYGDGHWLDYAAGAIPASKRVSDRYGADIPFYDLFRANAGNVWDFTGNNPDTQSVRDIFYTGIHDLLMGKTTPEECAAFLDERCNAAIDEGWAKSQLHE